MCSMSQVNRNDTLQAFGPIGREKPHMSALRAQSYAEFLQEHTNLNEAAAKHVAHVINRGVAQDAEVARSTVAELMRGLQKAVPSMQVSDLFLDEYGGAAAGDFNEFVKTRKAKRGAKSPADVALKGGALLAGKAKRGGALLAGRPKRGGATLGGASHGGALLGGASCGCDMKPQTAKDREDERRGLYGYSLLPYSEETCDWLFRENECVRRKLEMHHTVCRAAAQMKAVWDADEDLLGTGQFPVQKGPNWLGQFVEYDDARFSVPAHGALKAIASVPRTAADVPERFGATWIGMARAFDAGPDGTVIRCPPVEEMSWNILNPPGYAHHDSVAYVLTTVKGAAGHHRPEQRLTPELAEEIFPKIRSYPKWGYKPSLIDSEHAALWFLKHAQSDLGDDKFRELVNKPCSHHTLFQKVLTRGAMELVTFLKPYGDLEARGSDGQTAWMVVEAQIKKPDGAMPRSCQSIIDNYGTEGKLRQLFAKPPTPKPPLQEPVSAPRKRKRADATVEDEVWASRLKAYEWTYGGVATEAACICCNQTVLRKFGADGVSANRNYHRCHIVPKSAKGPNLKHNLIVACADCNIVGHGTQNALAAMSTKPLLRRQLPDLLRLLHARNRNPDESVAEMVERLYDPEAAPCKDAVYTVALRVDNTRLQIAVATMERRLEALEQRYTNSAPPSD